MTINLPDHLEDAIRAAVDDGRFASVDNAMAEAARLLLRGLGQEQPTIPQDNVTELGPDPFLGSMRDAADELDEIVAEAYRKRREETWRNIDVG